MVGADELRKMLDYDPETGVFRWLLSNSNRVKVGAVAGGSDGTWGYHVIGLRGKIVGAHRVAVAWMTGDWPLGYVDHINGNPSDNRWSNLRVGTQSQNLCNRGKQKNNTSGYKGVTFHRQSKKWQAKICFQGAKKSLGLFSDKRDAHAAYVAAAAKLHGDFARSE